ncbi:MAG: GIDE domain-containing protein [Gammaproteobacteria bacterium]|nr:GIDE domain-containing protein [Gammaproteobacteria bacterium]
MRQEILNAGPQEFWFWIAVLVAVALLAFYGVFRFFSRARLIEDTPTSKIRSAAQGYIELNGLAEPLDGTPIVAPLSKMQCVWYRYKIEERRHRHGHTFGTRREGDRWRTVEKGTSDGLFRLADETGECVVDPEGAEVTPSVHQVWYGGTHYPEQAPYADREGGWMARLGIGVSIGTGRYRYTESRIMPATDLYAIGQFRTLGTGGGGDRGADVAAVLRAWKGDQAALLKRFDADGDGQIDLQEWDDARRAAEAKVDADLRERQQAEPVNVLADPGVSRRPFILSVESQRELAGRLRLYAGACLVGFLGCGGAAVWAAGVRLAAG